NAETKARERVARAGAAADICRSRAEHTGFWSVRAASPELHNRPPRRGPDAPRRLAGDRRLERDGRHQARLGNLRLDDGRAQGQEWFAGKQGRAFRDGKDIPREAERAQVIEECPRRLAKLLEAAQILDLLVG